MKEEIKPKKVRRISIFTPIFCVFCITLILFSLYASVYSVQYIIDSDIPQKIEEKYIVDGLEISNVTLENNNVMKVQLVKPTFTKSIWYQILDESGEINSDNWIKVLGSSFMAKISQESKYIILKDKKVQTEKIPISNYINIINYMEVDTSDKLLLIQEQFEIDVKISYLGEPDKTIDILSENSEILEINNNLATAKNPGTTRVVIKDKYDHTEYINITVTDVITKPEINNNKPFLLPEVYTQEEAHMLDQLLEKRVSDAGLKTRAAVVAAARFLTLEFKYRVPYFLENGRYQNTGFSAKIDGEGRYYHKGLYLSKDKYADIKSSLAGPAMWGAWLYEYSNDRYMRNGLDCSGFVTWALYNGGYEPGDVGAGPNVGYTTLPDYGKSQYISIDLLKSGKVKAGDLIGWEGHIGIIIGIDNSSVYVADTVYEELGLVATKYTFEELRYESEFINIYDMSEYYGEDGNYTAMW